ncbi:hypothetical protein D3C76_1552950 [compost metagenome]
MQGGSENRQLPLQLLQPFEQAFLTPAQPDLPDHYLLQLEPAFDNRLHNRVLAILSAGDIRSRFRQRLQLANPLDDAPPEYNRLGQRIARQPVRAVYPGG